MSQKRSPSHNVQIKRIHGHKECGECIINRGNRQTGTISLFCYLTIFLFCFSCTYSFKSGHFGGTLSVFSLENNTQNADIGRILTEDLIDAFISDGRVKIETNSEGDFLLKGIIDDYTRTPQSYTPDGKIEEYRLSVNVRFSLKKKEKEENEWEKIINESFVYPSESQELEAVDSVAVKVKDSLLRLMLEEW
jgi:outer membrane lipopolysaccharide assembly protein LptE/RlpB